MIEFRDLTFSYREKETVIPDLSDHWEKGMVHALIGPSGCGKSSLLYLMAGLIKPVSGKIFVKGDIPQPGRRKTAVILQNHGLFPWKTASANLALGLKIRREKKDILNTKVARILKEMGLEGKAESYPGELSGGERQRLAIGRALILDPDLLLLDEPFSALDAMTREQLQDRLWQLKHKENSSSSNLTVVIVTHSIEEAVFLSDRIHIMNEKGNIHSLSNESCGPGYRMRRDYFDRCVALRNEFNDRTGKIL